MLIFTLAPAVRVRFGELREGLAEGSRGSSGNAWRRLGFKLVVFELATAMVMLVGAGLLGQSLYRLLHVDLGFDPDALVTIQVAAPDAAIPAARAPLTASTRSSSSASLQVPGIRSAGLVDLLPVTYNGNTDWIRFVGRPYNGEHNEVNQRVHQRRVLRDGGRPDRARPRDHGSRSPRHAESRRDQRSARAEVLPERGPARQAVRQLDAGSGLAQGDRRDRRGHPRGRAQRRHLAGRVLRARSGSDPVCGGRGAHVRRQRAGGAGSAGAGHSRDRSGRRRPCRRW